MIFFRKTLAPIAKLNSFLFFKITLLTELTDNPKSNEGLYFDVLIPKCVPKLKNKFFLTLPKKEG